MIKVDSFGVNYYPPLSVYEMGLEKEAYLEPMGFIQMSMDSSQTWTRHLITLASTDEERYYIGKALNISHDQPQRKEDSEMRKKVSLDGRWDFELLDRKPQNPHAQSASRKMSVPACVETYFPEITHTQHWLLYRKQIPWKGHSDRRVFLCFQASDYLTEAYWNGGLLGSHEGGFTPFEWEVTGDLQCANQLDVVVFDPIDDKIIDPRDIPHGKQNGKPNWYTNISGLWQSVYLEERTSSFIESITLSTSARAQMLSGHVHMNGDCQELEISLEKEGKTLMSLIHQNHQDRFSLYCQGIQPWSPDHPVLYTLRIRAILSKDRFDEKTWNIGFRDLEIHKGKILLNGKDFYMKGVLDQDFYPDTLYSLPSREKVKKAMSTIKSLGFNTLRCHVKIPDPIYMDLADELGLVVWQDTPYNDRFTEEGSRRIQATIENALQRDHLHPSLCIYALYNESWGLDMAARDQIQWLEGLYDCARKGFPGILIVDNSPCKGNYHTRSDLNDYHYYTSAIDRYPVWNGFLEAWTTNPGMTYLPGYEADAEGRPMLISEFGNWSLGASKWFDLSASAHYWLTHRFLDHESVLIQGARERFEASELRGYFTLDQFIDITTRAQLEHLRLQIRSIYAHTQIRGYVVTELADTFWETNGVLDFDRNTKADSDQLVRINRMPTCIVKLEKSNLWEDEPVCLHITCLGAKPYEGLLKLELDGQSLPDISPTISIQPGQTQIIELDNLAGKTDKEGVIHTLQLDLHEEPSSAHGCCWFTRSPKSSPSGIHFWQSMDEKLIHSLESGGVGILQIQSGSFSLGKYEAQVVSKEGFLSGDWVTGFHWAAPLLERVFPGGWIREAHQDLFEGAPLLESKGWNDRLIGITYGWFGAFFGYLESISVGKGLLWITTLRQDEDHPLMNVLLHRLVELQER